MSLHTAVDNSAKKMKKGMREMSVEKSDDGKGFIVTHHMHDYDNPKNGMKAICTSHAALGKHIKEHMPLEGGEVEEV